jgi:DNA primase
VLEVIPFDVEQGGDFRNNATITGDRIVRLPAGQDPDDFVRTNGPEAFRGLVENARPILDHYITEVVTANDSSIPGKLAALEEISAMLAKVGNPTARELYASMTAGVLGLSPQQVNRAFREAIAKAVRPTLSNSAPPVTAEVVKPAVLPAEELAVVVLLGTYPQLVRTADAARAGELLIHPVMRQLHRAAVEQVTPSSQLDVPTWLDTVGPDVRARLNQAMLDDSLTKTEDPPGLLRKLATRLELSRVNAEMDMNSRMQREAQVRGDEATLRALTVRGIELRKIKEGLLVALQRP